MEKFKDSFVFRNRTVFLGVILIILVHLINMILDHCAPLGDKVYVRGDNLAMLPGYINELKSKIVNHESLYYTWGVTGGGSYIYILAYSLLNITVLPLVFVPIEYLNSCLSIFYILISVFMFFTMSYYFIKRPTAKDIDGSSVELLLFAFPYALCPAFVNMSTYYPYSAIYVVLPLLLLGLERIVHGEGWKLYSFSLFTIMFLNFYIGAMCCLFIVLYYLTLKFSHVNDFVTKSIKVAVISLVSVGVTSIILIPIFLNVSGGGYGVESVVEPGLMVNPLYTLKQMLWGNSPVLVGMSDTTRWECNIYCGVLTLILALLSFADKRIGLSVRVRRSVLYLLFILSFNESVLNYVFHMFHTTAGNPNRHSMFFVIYSLILAYDGFGMIKHKLNRKSIAILGALVILSLVVTIAVGVKFSAFSLITINILLIIIYLLLLIFKKRFNSINVWEYTIALVVLAETMSGCCIVFNASTNDGTPYSEIRMVNKAVDSLNDDSFYYASYNDMDINTNMGMICGYNSFSGFSNIIGSDYSKALNEFGVNAYKNNIRERGFNSFLNSIFTRKYIFENVDNNHDYDTADRGYYSFVKTENNSGIGIYANDKVVGPALLMEQEMDEANASKDIGETCLDANNRLMKTLTGIDDAFSTVSVSPNVVYTDNCDAYMYEGYLVMTPSNEKSVYDSTKASKAQLSFIAPKDGEYIVDITNNYCAGYHKAGEEVKVNAVINGRDYNSETGAYATDINVMVLDIDKYNEAYDKMKRNAMNVASFKSDRIEGTINADHKGEVFTVIPYDASWKVEIDGKEVVSKCIDNAFLSFDINEGEHNIVLIYYPKGLALGIILSGMCILILVFAAVYETRVRR